VELKEALKVIDKLAALMGGALGEAWPVVKAAALEDKHAPTLELNAAQKLALAEQVLALVAESATTSAPKRRGRPAKAVTEPAAPVAVARIPEVAPAPASKSAGADDDDDDDDDDADFDQGFDANVANDQKAAALVAEARRKFTSPR
jgi:hypothetical protein